MTSSSVRISTRAPSRDVDRMWSTQRPLSRRPLVGREYHPAAARESSERAAPAAGRGGSSSRQAVGSSRLHGGLRAWREPTRVRRGRAEAAPRRFTAHPAAGRALEAASSSWRWPCARRIRARRDRPILPASAVATS